MTKNSFFSNQTIFYHQDDDEFFQRKQSEQHRSKRKENESHPRKKHPRKSQFDDERLFCDDCQQYHENICPYHQQTYVPDRKVNDFHLFEFVQ